MKCDRRWWNDGRVELECDEWTTWLVGEVDLSAPVRTAFYGVTLLPEHHAFNAVMRALDLPLRRIR